MNTKLLLLPLAFNKMSKPNFQQTALRVAVKTSTIASIAVYCFKTTVYEYILDVKQTRIYFTTIKGRQNL